MNRRNKTFQIFMVTRYRLDLRYLMTLLQLRKLYDVEFDRKMTMNDERIIMWKVWVRTVHGMAGNTRFKLLPPKCFSDTPTCCLPTQNEGKMVWVRNLAVETCKKLPHGTREGSGRVAFRWI